MSEHPKRARTHGSGWCCVVVEVALLLAGTARAAEDPASPSAALPVLGGAVALGGMAMTYAAARNMHDRDPGCVELDGGCFWLATAGALTAQIGGAIATFWAWRLGESDAARDGRAGVARDVHAYKVGGLIVGGLALATIYASTLYGSVAVFGCSDTGVVDRGCASRKAYVPTLLTLGAEAVLLVAAPVAGYGFGHAAGGARTASAALVPTVSASAAGLAIVGRY